MFSLTSPALWVLLGAFIAAGGSFVRSERKRKMVVFSGAALSAVGAWGGNYAQNQLDQELLALSQQVVEKTEENAILSRSIAERAGRNATLNATIAKQAEENTALSTKIAEQAEYIAGSVTGADSFCYLSVAASRDKDPFFVLVHKGEYPLFDLQFQIVDLDKGLPRQRDTLTEFFNDYGRIGNVQQIGALNVQTARSIGSVIPVSGDTARFNVFFQARNGGFTQILRVRRIRGEWVNATRVLRRDGGKTQKILFEKISDDYPREANGKVNWEE